MKGNSLKRFRLASLTTALLFASTSVWAQFDGTLDSASFDYKYEQDNFSYNEDLDLNTQGDWRTTSAPTTGLSGGILSFATAQFYRNDTGGTIRDQFAGDAAFTAEFSIKITTAGSEGTFGTVNLFLKDNPDESIASVNIGKTTVSYRFGTNTADITTLATGLNNTNAFHSYRIARLVTNAVDNATFFVWRDGSLLTPSGVMEHVNTVGAAGFFIGDSSTDVAGTFDLDYMRFDNDGAYSPVVVPEPSMVCLCLLGVLLAWQIQRRGCA